MIRKASELLEKFIEEETRKLDGFCMSHMPTLGSAYEEITKQGIYQDFAIPTNLNLKVVSGFISINGDMLPQQIDCMLVCGDGEQYGRTQQFKYDVEQVLCVFEVKKTLRKNDYIDALQHLAGIRRKFASNFERRLRDENYEPDIAHARKWFSQITGKVAPERYLDLHHLSAGDKLLFYTLVQESLAPMTIIHGYDGYKTEEGLRTVFLDILEDAWKNGDGRLGIPSIPTLVTSNNFCLVKGNGAPFLVMRNQDEWVSVFSTRHNSAKLILELIWSKISIYFKVGMPWGDELHMDSVLPLLIAKGGEINGKGGWVFDTIEYKERHMKRDDGDKWAPSKLGKAEVATLKEMALNGCYLWMDDDSLNDKLVGLFGVTIKEVAASLLLTREFMMADELVAPIHSITSFIENSDGTGFISSETNRFDIWCLENEVEPDYYKMVMLGH